MLALTGLAIGAEKPVQVYILSGQSNMVGIGQVGPMGASRMNTFVSAEKNAEQGAILSIYEGAFDPEADYEQKEAKETHAVRLGYWPHTTFPSIEGPSVSIARGFIRIDRAGEYSFRTTGNSIMEVDGKVMHRSVEGEEEVNVRTRLEPGTHPIRVTFLGSARSNMSHSIWDVPGTLTTLVHQQGKFPYLAGPDGGWVSRDDVWYRGVVTAGANKWLAPGCGANASQIGPELGFGHMVGNFHDEPVLIIKASQGNRSLAWDFLPPGSERFEVGDMVYAGYKDPKSSWPKGETPEEGGWYAGKQYDECFGAAKEVLAKFDESFPHWAGRGYEIAGFGWFQGHKDTGSEVHANRYESNLVNLIRALRKEFDAPDAPFVVAVGCGNEGREGTGLIIADAQLAVCGSTGKYPEFKGNVKSVDTRDYFPTAEESPRDQGYHYHQNAGAYMQIGEAMGKAMVELLKQ
ncbi:MAG: sialate O-acetylesterase [Luteolibacter sp.]